MMKVHEQKGEMSKRVLAKSIEQRLLSEKGIFEHEEVENKLFCTSSVDQYRVSKEQVNALMLQEG